MLRVKALVSGRTGTKIQACEEDTLAPDPYGYRNNEATETRGKARRGLGGDNPG